MTDRVRVAVVGTSWWTDAMYMPAIRNHPNADVRAVVGRNPSHTQEFAERWNVPGSYTNYEELLAREELDAVIICSPNNEHYPMSMGAIKRGLHVLCEKPLAMNYSEAAKMAQAADSAGVKTMVPFTYRFMPATRYLKELIENDYIGRPYHLNMRYYSGYAREGQYMWRFDLAESGAGVVGDLGTHWMYLARWFFGDIRAVTALLGHNVSRDSRPDGQPYEAADDAAIVMVEFENGAQGVLHMTAVAYEVTPLGQIHSMELHGSGGALHSFTDWGKIQSVSGARNGEGPVHELTIPEHIWGSARRDSVPNTYKDIFREHDFMARGFISAIVNNTHVDPDFHDGLKVQQCLEACLLSAREKRRVAVDEISAKGG